MNNHTIRIGKVMNVSGNAATVKFESLEGTTSGMLPVIRTPGNVSLNAAEGHTHKVTALAWLPSVGDKVLCVYDSAGTGYILGLV